MQSSGSAENVETAMVMYHSVAPLSFLLLTWRSSGSCHPGRDTAQRVRRPWL